jgi:hypothetical protein
MYVLVLKMLILWKFRKIILRGFCFLPSSLDCMDVKAVLDISLPMGSLEGDPGDQYEAGECTPSCALPTHLNWLYVLTEQFSQ